MSSDDETIGENNNNIPEAPVVVVISDEKICDATPENHDSTKEETLQTSTVFHRPQQVDSPAFSGSEASSTTDHNRRAMINKLVSISFDPEEIKDSLKECTVRLKMLTTDEIEQYKSAESENSVSSKAPSPSPSDSSSSAKATDKGRRNEVVKYKPKKNRRVSGSSLSYSRTKHEREKRFKEINRRLSRLVDQENSEDEDEKPRKSKKYKDTAKKSTTQVESKEKTKKPDEPSSSKKSKRNDEDSHSRKNGEKSSHKRSTSLERRSYIPSSHKKEQKPAEKRRKTIDSRDEMYGKKIDRRRKTIDTDRPSEMNLFSRPRSHSISAERKTNKDSNHKQSKDKRHKSSNNSDKSSSHKKSPEANSTKINETSPHPAKIPTMERSNSVKYPDQNRTNKRPRNLFDDNDEEKHLPKVSKYDQPPPAPLFSKAAKEIYDFPSISDNSPRISPVPEKINRFKIRRHLSMFQQPTERPSEESALRKELKLLKKNKEMRKRIKSVGERPTKTLIVNEDRKQKLKELTLNKPVQEAPPPPKENVLEQLEIKAPKSGTVKVNYFL